MAKTGIIHAHSTFSYDGEHTLEELVVRARSHGFDFLGMTEHAEALDEDQMRRFVRECKRLSDARFLVMPGLEFACPNDMHILGLGVEGLTDSRDPVFVTEFIRRQGGLAVVAHPGRAHYRIPTGLEAGIDGIEIWNARYDGWLVPNDRAIALWRNLRQEHEGLIAIGGQDLHAMRRRGYVRHVIPCDELSQPAIFRMLREGRFVISNAYLRLRPGALERPGRLASLAWARRMYLCARAVAKPIRDGFRRARGVRRTAVKARHKQDGSGDV